MSVFNKAWLRIITFFLSVVCVVLVVLSRVPPEGAESLEWSCSCRRCIMGSQEDDWFVSHYDPGAAPLLNRRNSRLAPDTERWWRGLQPSRLKVNYTELVERLFSLFPDQEHYSDGGPGRCRSCAVVGNSGNLLGSFYGPLIDQHHLVIRINKGPTEGYERDVGSKVTHRILYPESAVDLDNDTHLVLFPYKIRDLQWIISVFTTQHITRTYKRVKHTIKANENKVMILHPAFLRYVYESWLQRHGKYPSTGFITLIFALHICDEVNVFGFGATENGAWHHYFDKSRVHFKRGPHGGDYENITIHRLQQQNKIHIYKGYR